jgi:hypothetical protein
VRGGATGSPHDETCEALFMTSGFVPGRTARSGTRPRAAHRSSEIRPPSTAGSACRHNCRFALATKLEQRILSQVTPAIRGMSLESAH